MVDSLSDPRLEGEMKSIKNLLESLKRDQTIFMNTFSKMKPSERVVAVKNINLNHTKITLFIENAKKYDLRATALKFGLENIRQKHQLLAAQWRRIEKQMESGAVGGPALKPPVTSPAPPSSSKNATSATSSAVEQYVQSLSKLGHKATPEMIGDFKTRIEAAYKVAKEKSGGREITIQVVQDSGKIKVRMEPK